MVRVPTFSSLQPSESRHGVRNTWPRTEYILDSANAVPMSPTAWKSTRGTPNTAFSPPTSSCDE